MKKQTEKKGLELMTMNKDEINAIASVEDVGTAMMRSGTQVILAVEDILEKQFGFTEKDLKKVETNLKHYLKTLAHLTRNNLLVLNPKDMESVGFIAQKMLLTEKAARSGIALPTKAETQKLLTSKDKK